MKRNFMRDNILVDNPVINSRASYILLINDLSKLDDVLFRKYHPYKYLRWREEFLNKKKEEDGLLFCKKCFKGPLIIYRKDGTLAGNKDKMIATIDHIIPISRGGSLFEESNIDILCYKCNQKKADKLPRKRLKKSGGEK